jgi:Ulp1 family protease
MGTMLNDSLINFYFEFLVQEANPFCKAYALNSHFLSKLCGSLLTTDRLKAKPPQNLAELLAPRFKEYRRWVKQNVF